MSKRASMRTRIAWRRPAFVVSSVGAVVALFTVSTVVTGETASVDNTGVQCTVVFCDTVLCSRNCAAHGGVCNCDFDVIGGIPTGFCECCGSGGGGGGAADDNEDGLE